MRSEQHHFASHRVRCVTFALVAAFSTPAFAQSDVQAVVLKHLKTSRETEAESWEASPLKESKRPSRGVDLTLQKPSISTPAETDPCFVGVFHTLNQRRAQLYY